jgi:ArsR family transcriptional regulator, arsenate/arsenite/antimonite-responsive transcriptional repressor / arsenate reductase (thioredoxin)
MSVDQDPALRRRAAVHAALSDPMRLAVVDLLALSDAAPSELQSVLGVPSNLLAHHLRVLENAGLVERSRSEGDRRRTYLRLVRGALGRVATVPTRTAPRVLFVCTHNSARSQLAAALWRLRSTIPTASAGTHPAEHVHPGAITAASRRGLALPGPRTAHLDAVARDGDLVVAVCDNAHEELPRATARWHWSVPDPVRAGTDDAFDHTIDNLTERIDGIAPHLRPA